MRDAYTTRRVRTRAQLDEHARDFLARNYGRELHDPPHGAPPLEAYVNWGRWVADCTCGAGILVSPRDRDAPCLECGLVQKVDFPSAAARKRAEELLERRAEARQNWRPSLESIADLEAENAAHDVSIRR